MLLSPPHLIGGHPSDHALSLPHCPTAPLSFLLLWFPKFKDICYVISVMVLWELLSCLCTVSARTELLCVSTVSLLADQDQHFLLAPRAVIGPTERHSSRRFVRASHSLSSDSLASSSFVPVSSIPVECDALQDPVQGLQSVGMKRFRSGSTVWT